MNKKLAALLIPLMLLPLAGFAYASWSDFVTKTYLLTAGTVDIAITGGWIEETNAYGYIDIYGDGAGNAIIEAEDLFPSWYAVVTIEIHNDGTLPVEIIFDPETDISAAWDGVGYLTWFPSGFYWDFDGSGTFETEERVFEYEDGFWWDEVKEATPPIELEPSDYVYKVEYLHFSDYTQEHPELQGKSFTIVVTITAVQAVP